MKYMHRQFMRVLWVDLLMSLVVTSSLYGQKLECNQMVVSLRPQSFGNDSIMNLHVELDLDTHQSSDTIMLFTNVRIGEPSIEGNGMLAPSYIKAYDYYNKEKTFITTYKNECGSAPFSDKQIITVMKGNVARVKVEYDVMGTFFFFDPIKENNNDDRTLIYAYCSEEESVFPTNVFVKDILVEAPDSFYALKSIKTSGNEESRIYIAFVSKTYVEPDTMKTGNLSLTFYNMKGDKPTLKNAVTRAMNKLSSIAPVNGDLDILRVLYRSGNWLAGHSLGRFCILDKDMKYESCVHEILHSIFDNRVSPNTKGRYFVSESLIEWLAQYLNEKRDTTKWGERPQISIYDLESDDTRTACLIYGYGPELLYEVADQVGMESLAMSIIEFMLDNKGKDIDYNSFISFMRGRLPGNVVDMLDRKVRKI